MPTELKVPALGESVTDVEISQWLKAEGESVKKDETLALVESSKATMELPSPVAGVVTKLFKAKGQTALVGEVIALIDESGTPTVAATPAPKKESAKSAKSEVAPAAAAPAPAPVETRIMPAAERVLAESNVSVNQVTPTGPGGRMLKEDVLLAAQAPAPAPAPAAPAAPVAPVAPVKAPAPSSAAGRVDEVVPMTRLRRTLADRLVGAQNTAALLTTFNEVDMSGVMALRKEYQEAFTARYGVKLGFMSFFVKAVVDGLKLVPEINAEIRGTDIVYHRYFDIGVAVGGGRGLVVPVLRDADRLSFAQLEQKIADFGKRAKENKLSLDELTGGTFTISNGGVYGSLLSTPIVSPPQSGILGMHTIQERPVAIAGQVVIRPMMYIALTYDHRIVDGREAVSFLKRVKETVENPTRMLLEV